MWLFCRIMIVIWMLAGGAGISSVRADNGDALRDLEIGIGFSLSPYIFRNEDRGAEYELVEAVLADAGYRIRPRYVSMNRRIHEFVQRQVDGILTLPISVDDEACMTVPYIHYQNVAVTLERRDIVLKEVEDLLPYSVVAFQTAHKIISPDYSAMAARHKSYLAISTQKNQALMLFRGRVDIAVSDINILRWYARELAAEGKIDIRAPVRIHPLFPPSAKRASFWRDEVCTAFDRSLRKLREKGEVSRILGRYGLFEFVFDKQTTVTLGK